MIKNITIINYLKDSITIDFRKPEETGFLIKSITGLGPSKANINTTEVSTTDGSIFNSARMTQRNIVMDIIFAETEKGESIEDIRQKTYKYFPVKKKIKLIIETENRLLSTDGYVESNNPLIFSNQESCQISILCPDAYFYSYSDKGNDITIFSGIESNFEFPYSNESLTEKISICGYIQIKTENIVLYNGDSEIGVIIHIHAIGPVSNIKIYNMETREKMAINSDKIIKIIGEEILTGDDIIINTMKSQKGVTLIRGGKSFNIRNCLDKNTDWFTLAKGDNIFAFTAESGVTNLQFWIENKIMYEGV